MNIIFISQKQYSKNRPQTYLGASKPWRQAGQAMVEFFSVMLVLIPLFWAVFTLGKFLDFDNAGRQAARYVNWEQTVGRTIANITANDEVRQRFLQSPLGGLDPDILNQPLLNPLWSMPALSRPPSDAYFIVDPNQPVVINRNTIVAPGLTSVAGIPGNENTIIQSINVNIPLDTLPWELSQYPDKPVVANAPNIISYQAALLSNTFTPNSEKDIRLQLPAAKTMGSLDTAGAETVLALFDATGILVNFFGIRSYPYAEVWDHNFLTFFDTTANSAILPDSRLQ